MFEHLPCYKSFFSFLHPHCARWSLSSLSRTANSWPCLDIYLLGWHHQHRGDWWDRNTPIILPLPVHFDIDITKKGGCLFVVNWSQLESLKWRNSHVTLSRWFCMALPTWMRVNKLNRRIRCDVMWYDMIWYDTICDVMWCNITMWYVVMWYDMIYDTLWYVVLSFNHVMCVYHRRTTRCTIVTSPPMTSPTLGHWPEHMETPDMTHNHSQKYAQCSRYEQCDVMWYDMI